MTDQIDDAGHVHYSGRSGWLRAAVLGANDGIVSIAGLIIGVAAARVTQEEIMIAGVAGLVAGAMSMAAGEYVSVSSQADTEKADLELEKAALSENTEYEREELASIYQSRGLDPALAREVAIQLMEHDALGAHARDDIGLTEVHSARPIQAAFTSAFTFSIGAALPILVSILAPLEWVIYAVAATSLVCLASLGGLAAGAGGAPVLRGMARVGFWGAAAMVLTYAVGSLFGVSV